LSSHLTYLEAVVTGLVQGVTELFPVSSLGHNVLIPALVGGSWASALNVSAPNSPYLAFIVGLHVATAIAMIAYFWRDWLRIVRGFFSSIRKRSATTPDERLAWMIILATIPVGIVGATLQKVFINVFAKPELAALFLAINGVILLGSERMRRSSESSGRAGGLVGPAEPARVPGGAQPAGPGPQGGRPLGRERGPQGGWPQPGGPAPQAGWPQPGGPGTQGGWPQPGGPGPQGYTEQPRQQQWQGPDPRYGQGDEWQRGQQGDGRYPQGGQGQYGPPGQSGQPGQYGQQPQNAQPGPYGRDPRGGQPGAGQPPAGDPRDPRGPQYQQPSGRHGHAAGRGAHGGGPASGGPTGGGHAGGHSGGGPTGGGHAGGRGGGNAAGYSGGHAAGRGPGGRGVDGGAAADPAVVADRRLSTMGYKRAVLIGSAQILALLPGISRDGIVTVGGMWRGLRREDAVRFSFLLSAPVILAAGALKAKDLTGPLSKGIHGPILVGSLIAFVGAYVSIRFLTKYFSEDKSLNPFGIYCLIAGLGSLAYLVLK
jgi:undecaprenyl pyrophosphate phosphatase UppP